MAVKTWQATIQKKKKYKKKMEEKEKIKLLVYYMIVWSILYKNKTKNTCKQYYVPNGRLKKKKMIKVDKPHTNAIATHLLWLFLMDS